MKLPKVKKWLSYGILMVVLTIAVAGMTTVKNNKYLSNESALALKDLNSEYDMVITEDLLNDHSSSRLMASLLQANILTSSEEAPVNQGLIVTFKENENGILLVQPTENLSEDELKKIADNYEEIIPEANFEVDQNIIGANSLENYVSVSIIENPVLREQMEKEIEKNSIEVAVIDSGIQKNHKQFEDVNVSVNLQANLLYGGEDVADDVGHGTHVAGIIAENAPEAVIKPYKIVDQNGGRLSHVIKAVNLAIEDEVEVINMSFGVMENSYALENIIKRAEEEGIIVVAAAGNFGSDQDFFPAVYDGTIAVGGVYDNGRKMRSSNYGDWVDVAAYGYRVNSSVPNDRYGYKDGTSQSTAFVSAEIAQLMIENPKLNSEEIMELLQGNKKVRSGEFVGLPIISGSTPK
ncbi:S8 family serine peptidase [Candidatus Peregrinibacteria bacterium]|jgi:subtilisin family serine protease|nr:S8 family serine peptidase [Candidatus Peregrinibacteria bacterium]MBT7484347.1 S8 family serine peptidase [Candidatus Peregrinibacteria bacterium]